MKFAYTTYLYVAICGACSGLPCCIKHDHAPAVSVNEIFENTSNLDFTEPYCMLTLKVLKVNS